MLEAAMEVIDGGQLWILTKKIAACFLFTVEPNAIHLDPASVSQAARKEREGNCTSTQMAIFRMLLS